MVVDVEPTEDEIYSDCRELLGDHCEDCGEYR
jgi:hypothetical protein